MDKKENSYLSVLQARSLREIVEKVNTLQIKKDDVLNIITLEDSFYLLYYK